MFLNEISYIVLRYKLVYLDFSINCYHFFTLNYQNLTIYIKKRIRQMFFRCMRKKKDRFPQEPAPDCRKPLIGRQRPRTALRWFAEKVLRYKA